jgi:hypothetical protein
MLIPAQRVRERTPQVDALLWIGAQREERHPGNGRRA